MFKREKLSRYRQLAQLAMKYGRRDFLDAASAELGTEFEASEAPPEGTPGPEELATDLSALGPTFIKLAQLLSTRGDLLAQPYLDALARLQDQVDGFPFATVDEIVTAELGVRLSKAFAYFDETPLAAASLGQVHRATLRDGREVVVKVQRPGVREQIVEDLDMFETIAGAIDRHTDLGRRYDFSSILARFRETLLAELDYRQEARNLETMRAELEQFEVLTVPEPVPDYTTSRVLTMEFIDGSSVASISPLTRQSVDLRGRAKTLCEAYMHQILVAGFFHSDPHPGNLLLTADGQLAIIDLGMVTHVDPELRLRLLRLLLAVCDGRGRETAELGIDLGRQLHDFDRARLIDEVSSVVTRRQHQVGSERKLGGTLLELARRFAANGLRPPAEISLLGKTLLTLDEVATTLDPDFDPDEMVDGYAHRMMREQLLGSLNPSRVFANALDVQGFAEKLPRRIGTVLDALASGRFQVKIDALDEARLLASLERIGNRIALGLVLAALIVGAALVMQVDSPYTLFGYPALAIVLFLAAVVLGFAMVVGIMLGDRRARRRS